jgi:hypothetical protein
VVGAVVATERARVICYAIGGTFYSSTSDIQRKFIVAELGILE